MIISGHRRGVTHLNDHVHAAGVADVSARPAILPRAAQLCEAIAVVLLGILAYRIFFSLERTFDGLAFGVSVAAFAAAALRGDSLRSGLEWPLAAYIGLLAVSALVHDGVRPGLPAQAALHTVVLAVFMYALAYVLRTPRRLAAAAAWIVLAVNFIGFQATAYHVATGIDGRPGGYPTVQQWLGYPELGVLMTVALAFPLGVIVAGTSFVATLLALCVAAILTLFTTALYSRSADVTLVVSVAILGIIELVKRRRLRLLATLVPLALVGALFVAKNDTLSYFVSGPRMSLDAQVRRQVWSASAAIVRAHPWFGVGAGNYRDALRETHLTRFDMVHAHNMMLHIAAESGIPAMCAFGWLWLLVFRMLWRLWPAREAPDPVSAGIFGALVAFFVRALMDHFFTGLETSERMSYVLWTLFAMTAAAWRAPAGADA
jgi:O-antigen ligase